MITFCVLVFQAHVDGECVGAIVCKLDFHKKIVKRGYIAMLAVDSSHRKRKIGSTLVKKAIQAMIDEEADEVLNLAFYTFDHRSLVTRINLYNISPAKSGPF